MADLVFKRPAVRKDELTSAKSVQSSFLVFSELGRGPSELRKIVHKVRKLETFET